MIHMKKFSTQLSVLAGASLFALPLLVSAQQLQPIRTLLGSVGYVLNALIPLMMALSVVAFFWGLFGYIRGGDWKTKGQPIMIAGIVSLFVMVSIWGLVRVLQNTLDIQPGGAIQPPTVPILN